MGTADAMQRIKTEDEKDFFQTPYLVTEALIKNYSFLKEDPTLSILDPCAGERAIGKVLDKHHIHLLETDLYPTSDLIRKADFLEYRTKHDVIIMNPPYRLKNQFIDHALEISKHVFVILPMAVVNYNIFHRKYLNRPEYRGRLLLTPKFFMSKIINEDYSLERGGISSYAWFHYSTTSNQRSSYSYERYEDLDNLKEELFENLPSIELNLESKSFNTKPHKLSYDFWDNMTRIIENDKNFLVSAETLLLQEVAKQVEEEKK